MNYAGFNYVAASNNINVAPFPVTATWTLIPSGGGGGGGGLTNPLTTNLDLGTNDIINTNDTQTTSIGVDVIDLRAGSLAPRITVSQGMDFTSITSTTFSGALPESSIVPTTGDQLCNKTYVDGVVAPPGPPGPPGAAATITVGSTTTLAPGSSATVVNSGSSSAAILDFGIPEGQQGVPGPPGPSVWVGTATSDLNMSQFNITNVPIINVQEGTYQNYTELRTQSASASNVFFSAAPKVFPSGGIPSTYGIQAGYDNNANVYLSWDQATPANSLAVLEAAGGTVSLGDMNAYNNTRIDLTTYNNDINLNANTIRLTPNTALTTTLDVSGSIVLSGSASTATPPTLGDHLTNKTYVDSLISQRPTNMYFVSKNGNDTTGNGSINNPYLTIQKAITVAETGALPNVAAYATIMIGPGNYTENLTMTDGYTNLCAYTSDNRAYSVKILGTITIAAAGANDLYNRVFSLQGLLVRATGANPCLIDSTVSTEHSVVAKNCRFIADDRAFYQNAGGNTRNIFTDCYFGHENASAVYTNPLVEMAGASWLECLQCEFYAQNTQCDVLRFSGASYPYKLGLCQFISSSTSATANPLIRYATTNASVGSVGQCSFTFESATAKTSAGFLFDTGGRVYSALIPVINFIQNAFILNGTSLGGNAIARSGTTTGTPFVLSGNQIAAPQTAQKIQAGGAITHLQYNTVN